MVVRNFQSGRLLAAAILIAGLAVAGIAASLSVPALAASRAHKVGASTDRDKKEAPKPAPKKEVKKDDAPIVAPHAMLIDAQFGAVLFERGADDLIFPASLAKLMTAEYVFNELKQGRIKLTDEFRVSANAWRKGGAPSHGSTMFAAIDSKINVDDLLHGMIILSGNDAAIVLAEGLAGNELEFGEKLTARAREIGMPKSVFANSNGLPDPRTHVTSRELATLARQIILEYPEYYKIFSQLDFTWSKIHQMNRNPLLGTVDGADGLKTGFTNEAGYGLVGSAIQNGQRLIVVVNGEKSEKERADEAKKLLEWGWRNFEPRTLFTEGQTIGAAKVYGGATGQVSLKSTGDVQVMLPKNGPEKLIARIVYSGDRDDDRAVPRRGRTAIIRARRPDGL